MDYDISINIVMGGDEMTTKSLERLWKAFPESHVHCDVTKAGIDSYRIVASLISQDGNTIREVEHYGSGHLDTLKEQVFERLASEVNTSDLV